MKKYAENKKSLEEEKELLLSELKKIGAVKSNMNDNDYQAKSTDTETDVEDIADTAQNINNLRRQETIITELEARLISVDLAIKKIESEKYGFCSVCKKEIEEKRLRVNPAASTCVEHMEV